MLLLIMMMMRVTVPGRTMMIPQCRISWRLQLQGNTSHFLRVKWIFVRYSSPVLCRFHEKVRAKQRCTTTRTRSSTRNTTTKINTLDLMLPGIFHQKIVSKAIGVFGSLERRMQPQITNIPQQEQRGTSLCIFRVRGISSAEDWFVSTTTTAIGV